VEFEVDEAYLDARRRFGVEILALVVPRDESGSLQCSVPATPSEAERVWFDSSGYKWVRLDKVSKISYSRRDNTLNIGIDGIQAVSCHVNNNEDIKLNVLFTLLNTPLWWREDGASGFEVSLPVSSGSGTE
jgi:hypothetical protein